MFVPVLILSVLFPVSLGHNYLIMHPFYAGSHVLTMHTVAQKLVQNGHKVTTVRFADPYNLTLRPLGANHSEIVLYLNNSDGAIPYTTKKEQGIFALPSDLLWSDGQEFFTLLKLAINPWDVINGYCNQLLSNQELINTLKKVQFDVVVVDLIYNECGLAFTHMHIKPPSGVVGYWAFSFSGGEAEFTPVATPPSHIPTFMSALSHEMSFLERVRNFGHKAFARCLMLYHTYVCDGVVQQFCKDCPSTRDLLADLNGVLINSDDILDYPRLQPKSYVNVGGLQIKDNMDPLTEPISSFIEGAENGVILFTMGFIFNPSHVPASRVSALLSAFGRLPQRVIFKFDGQLSSHTLPPNVLAVPFVPQQAILAHPKTILFFTHCGMHGVMEAVYHSVPMVGMPVFIDQVDVRVRMEEKGIGLGIDKTADSEEIYQAIVQVRDDGSYKENVQALSKLMKLRRHHPMDDAIWLLEHLAETRGAEYMKLSSRKLNTLQYLSLDVIAFLVVLVYCLVKLLTSLCGRRSNKIDKVKKS